MPRESNGVRSNLTRVRIGPGRLERFFVRPINFAIAPALHNAPRASQADELLRESRHATRASIHEENR